jgi:hypothetical protein
MRRPNVRFRNSYIIFGGLLTIALLILTDPDAGYVQQLNIGAGTITTMVILFKGILGSTLLYVTRKAMFDYPEADFQKLGESARRSPEGAGYYAIAMGLSMVAFAIVIVGAFHT